MSRSRQRIQNLDRLRNPGAVEQDVSQWAVVTQASPLRIKLDGESTALPFTPDSLVKGLLVGDRVRVMLVTNKDPQFRARRTIVIGRSGGYNHTHWGDQVVCKLRRVAAQTLADNTLVPIQYDTETVDTHNAHSTVTNPSRFNPPVNGIYGYAGLASYTANATNRRSVEILKNGSINPGSQVISPAFAVGVCSLFFAGTIDLVTTDYMEVEQWQNSGSSLTTSTANTEANVTIWLMLAT